MRPVRHGEVLEGSPCLPLPRSIACPCTNALNWLAIMVLRPPTPTCTLCAHPPPKQQRKNCPRADTPRTTLAAAAVLDGIVTGKGSKGEAAQERQQMGFILHSLLTAEEKEEGAAANTGNDAGGPSNP
jgi:hypothetical protein